MILSGVGAAWPFTFFVLLDFLAEVLPDFEELDLEALLVAPPELAVLFL